MENSSNHTSSKKPIELEGYARETDGNMHRYNRKRRGWWLMVLFAWDAFWRKER